MLASRSASLTTCNRQPAVSRNVVSLSTRRAPLANRLPLFLAKAAASDATPTPTTPPATPAAVPEVDPVLKKLRASAGFMKNLSFVAFWAQLALALSSAGVLLFSLAVSPMTDASKWLTVVGVVFAFISSFFAHGFLTITQKLQAGDKVDPNWMVSNLLRNSSLNLWGIGATVIGLQASVGTLVAKSLMGAAQGGVMYAQNPSNALVSVDVFALQASTNTLLCHVVGLVFANWMLGTVNKAMPKPTAA